MPYFEQSGSGSIVIISSTNALETFGVPQAYNAMKAALVTYAKQLSQHVGKRGVRVNCSSQSWVWRQIRPYAGKVMPSRR